MWLSDFTLVLSDRIVEHGSVHIENGVFTDIVDHPVANGINGRGCMMMPGFIDMHGDMIELELEPRTNVHFPMEVALPHLDARLAAAGVTTAFAAVSFSRAARKGERRSFEHTSDVIRQLYQLRKDCRVDHRIHARFDITFDNAVGVLSDLVRGRTGRPRLADGPHARSRTIPQYRTSHRVDRKTAIHLRGSGPPIRRRADEKPQTS